ncbi:Astacin (Peptidase M12A) [Parelaphostrongylus tenuis]|uniref:Metalloendopeptidase n=1 Tax=Parelaphostrongylus tenuis TaxID=148309 RepID=A0AAD5QCJ5_PARTN|nr:Astacin (Peptidase M12A) [Parelaphostrongylus tenuis]
MSALVFRKQADEIMEDIEDNGGNRRKRQAFLDENYPKTIWSNGMTYAFWNSSKPEGDRVMVVESVGCWSHIGRIGGQQLLSLGAGCEHIGIAVHEIGHALGLFHTQSRHDRDQFITLYENNIQTNALRSRQQSARTVGSLIQETVRDAAVPVDMPYGCGKILTATDSYETLNDTVGRWDYDPDGDNDEFYMCHYWIQGPPGSTIEVILDDYTVNLGVDGCIFAGVEIKLWQTNATLVIGKRQ